MTQDHSPVHAHRSGFAAVAVAAVGIVYGAIGTSPLYALNQFFFRSTRPALTPDDVVGGLSLVIWTITAIVAIKYAVFVLRAHNDGEGGVFALYGLLHHYKARGTRILLWSLMFGAGLLLSDGIITPAISILSALEGLAVATPAFAGMIVPIAVTLLTALFAAQFKGTSGIGRVFGPVLLVWFAAIAILGAVQIVHHPGILAAFDPVRAVGFLSQAGAHEALPVLAALILVVGGAEAMYADLGHFGSRPIRTAWFGVVYPALLLNYLGQGAYLLSGSPVAGGNLFFNIVPAPLLYPMVLLATAATVVASQALISGVFSLAAQAIRLGLFPRLALRHTHHSHAGQVYIPFINWSLFAGCILLVFGFGSSTRLGPAYGLTVAGVMIVTSAAMIAVAHFYWQWGRLRIVLLWGTLTALNAAFLLASALEFLDGGFVPVTIGTLIFLVMATWRWGRKATFAAYSARPAITMAELVRLHRDSPVYMERNAILMAPKPLRLPTDRAPALLRLLWERYGILPRNMIFVEVTHRKMPYIHDGRCQVTVFDRTTDRGSIIAVELQFGFTEEPNIERILEEMARHQQIDLPPDHRQWIVHVSLENLLPARTMGLLRRLRFRLFVLMRRNSQPAYYDYGLGDRVQLSAEIIPVHLR